MPKRANALADRIEAGAKALGDYAAGLTDAQWRTPITPDGRTAGVLVNHVASVYPLEADLLKTISAEAAARVRAFTDDELDSAAGISLNGDAPLTSQFMLEDHALRHRVHHLAKIRAVLG